MNSRLETPTRPHSESPAHSMKIYFCDICNESIPLKDINTNSITIEEGKIFCQKCAPKRPSTPGVTPGVIATLIALTLAVLGLGFGLWKVWDEQQTAGLARADEDRVQGAELTRMSGLLESIQASLRTLEEHDASMREDLSESRGELQHRHDLLDEREANDTRLIKERLTREFSQLSGALKSQGTTLSAGLQDLKLQFEGSRGRWEGLRDRLELIETLVTSGGGEVSSPVAEEPTKEEPADPDAGSAGKDVPLSSEAKALIGELDSSDPGKRYGVVLSLVEHKHPKVAEALASHLSDSQDYIRIAIVEALRDFGYKEVAPQIIGALRDSEYLVRAYSKRALGEVLGEAITFNPDGDPSSREREVRALEAWWKENSARILETTPSDGGD